MERRTYGASNLKATILEWDTLVRQIRVCLFLSSRVNGEVAEPFTVHNIEEGVVSLHRLLALDTLCFAPAADAALEVTPTNSTNYCII